ncbi:MAG: NUDIX domain-containing protein [Pseudonocardia sp.]
MTEEAERFATPRVAAGALFVDDEGRVLLLHPTYKDTWDIPGGYVERGESPASACEREVHEEIGLRRTANRLLAVDWALTKRRVTSSSSSSIAASSVRTKRIFDSMNGRSTCGNGPEPAT